MADREQQVCLTSWWAWPLRPGADGRLCSAWRDYYFFFVSLASQALSLPWQSPSVGAAVLMRLMTSDSKHHVSTHTHTHMHTRTCTHAHIHTHTVCTQTPALLSAFLLSASLNLHCKCSIQHCSWHKRPHGLFISWPADGGKNLLETQSNCSVDQSQQAWTTKMLHKNGCANFFFFFLSEWWIVCEWRLSQLLHSS